MLTSTMSLEIEGIDDMINSYTLEQLKILESNYMEKRKELDNQLGTLYKDTKQTTEEKKLIDQNFDKISKEIYLRESIEFSKKIDELLLANPDVFNSDEVKAIKKTNFYRIDNLEFIINEVVKIKTQYYKNWKLKYIHTYSSYSYGGQIDFVDTNEICVRVFIGD